MGRNPPSENPRSSISGAPTATRKSRTGLGKLSILRGPPKRSWLQSAHTRWAGIRRTEWQERPRPDPELFFLPIHIIADGVASSHLIFARTMSRNMLSTKWLRIPLIVPIGAAVFLLLPALVRAQTAGKEPVSAAGKAVQCAARAY